MFSSNYLTDKQLLLVSVIFIKCFSLYSEIIKNWESHGNFYNEYKYFYSYIQLKIFDWLYMILCKCNVWKILWKNWKFMEKQSEERVVIKLNLNLNRNFPFKSFHHPSSSHNLCKTFYAIFLIFQTVSSELTYSF